MKTDMYVKKNSLYNLLKIYHLKLKIIGDALNYSKFFYLLYKC
jgi:hypothetical protein